MRIGLGYDVHRLVAERDLILGGVHIPYHKGLLGHSDADVLSHAIMDALLGAVALGDIGVHFPDSDQRYKDADSLILLKQVRQKVLEVGYTIVNIDSVVMAEKPKLKPYVQAIRTKLADALNCVVDQISVKATTTEKLGFVGKEEGIAVQAIVLLEQTKKTT